MSGAIGEGNAVNNIRFRGQGWGLPFLQRVVEVERESAYRQESRPNECKHQNQR